MPGPVTDPRAGAVLAEYRDAFGGPELPVPVESIAEDLLSLIVDEDNLGDCSGLLDPAERPHRPERDGRRDPQALHPRPRARPSGLPSAGGRRAPVSAARHTSQRTQITPSSARRTSSQRNR